MKIKITKIVYQNDYILVEGITDVGIIKGIWQNDESPNIGNIYYFELDIDSIDVSEVSVIKDNNAIYEVRIVDNNCVFTGRCEEIDDIYVIRFLSPTVVLFGCSHHLHRRHKPISVSSRFGQGWRTGSNMNLSKYDKSVT